ncbi:hypothetical protein IFT54_05555 [Sphingomonas sp. CFBP 13714]|uniref:hypothetical protein n=1 Tax=Sphingomonas sp. CFBP 13714 TaxID=2775308 RepID=UPI00177F0640|nr:hypothetical protein [Sphingomonas sp. CFBP 13714]MBD8699281.1 hypothetical protein [Sphingomonas sp. CFBP 13714]
MATLEQATTYNEIRGNEAWADLDAPQAAALLIDAEDYIRSAYPIRSSLDADEQRVFDGLVCRLAAIFQKQPPAVAGAQAIKKESKEGAGFKKETEYVAAPSDPYPYLTAVIRPFLRTATTSAGFAIGRLIR